MTGQGADERRIRQLLSQRGVSYAPTKPASAPVPAERPRDWLDDILTSPRPEAAPRLPDWRKGETADLHGPDPDRPVRVRKSRPAPPVDDEQDEDEEWADVDDQEQAQPKPGRRSRIQARGRLHAEYLGLPRRIRWVLYTGAAAAAGYAVGLAPLMNGWIVSCGQDTSPKAALLVGLGLVVAAGVLIDHRTRHWWGPLPWLCRIPLASALLALALYAPGVTR